MSWYLLFLLFIISTVVQSLWQRFYSKSSDLPNTIPPTLSYLFALMPIGILIGIFMPHHVSWSIWVVFLLIVEGAFIAAFNWLMFVALRHLSVAKFELIFQLYTVVVICLGWLLLGEKLTHLQLAGGLLLLVAAYIAIQAPQSNERELHRHAEKKAIIITVLAALAIGIGLVTEKAALQYMDLGAYFIFGFGTQTLALLILAAKDLKKHKISSIKNSEMRQILFMGVLSVTVGITYIGALRLSNNISLIAALSPISLPLMVLASYFFLHERENMKKMWLATVLSLIGLVIVSL